MAGVTLLGFVNSAKRITGGIEQIEWHGRSEPTTTASLNCCPLQEKNPRCFAAARTISLEGQPAFYLRNLRTWQTSGAAFPPGRSSQFHSTSSCSAPEP